MPVRLLCEWIAADPDRVGVGFSRKFDLRVALLSPVEAQLVEAAFMNIIWDLLILGSVLIAVTISCCHLDSNDERSAPG
jgi:hypothetical protein